MGFLRVYAGDSLIDQVELAEGELTIGRSSDNGLVLNDSGVSRVHAKIYFRDGNYHIKDNGSQNGVFINKQKVDDAKLKYHDEIQIYNYVLKFMHSASLQKRDELSADVDAGDSTVFNPVAASGKLDELRSHVAETYLQFQDKSGATQKLVMKKPTLSIGGAKDADLRIKGWFVPKSIAKIERRGKEFVMVPVKKGKITLKSQSLDTSLPIKDGDSFQLRGQVYQFYHRVTKQ